MSTIALLRNNKYSLLFLLILFILPFIASSILIFTLVKHEEIFHAMKVPYWILFYIAASITMALSLTHTTLISLITGYFLGWQGLIYMIPAYLLASYVGYYLAWFIDQGKLFDSLGEMPRVKSVILNLKKKEFQVISFARLSPVLPFAIMNALLSYLKARMPNYLLGGLVGMLPRTLLFIYIGMKATYFKELVTSPEKHSGGEIAFIVLLVVSVGGLFFFIKKAVSQTSNV